MKNSRFLFLLLSLLTVASVNIQALAFPGALAGTQKGQTGGGPTIWNNQYHNGAGIVNGGDAPEDQGGRQKTENQRQKCEDKGLDEVSGGKTTIGDKQCNVPASAIRVNWPAGLREAYRRNAANSDGMLPTNSETQLYLANFVATLAAGVNAPDKQMHAAKSNLDSQAMEMANALADLEKQQAASAIDFCSSFLINFTTDGANKWNKLRDGIFVPMAVLLLLPGAMLTQVKSIMAAGNPVLGEANPFEGIQRAIIAIFLIPGTYLVINYSIDLNNSVTLSIADEYTQIFGTDMYRDAISFHIRAFPARQPGENRNALDQQTAKMGPLLNGTTAFARFEGMMIENKIEDPVAGIYLAPPDRADEALPAAVIAAKEMFNSTNATFMIAWNILCAFQMIYFYYLWFVGPITAALWAWPMKSLRGAFPSWCEGVITLGFWSLFWNTSILLMACFRGVDETGTLVITALNFLATSSVKYAFDFAGLAKAAGQEAANMAEKAMQAAQKGGGGGGKGGGGSKGHGHSAAGHRSRNAGAHGVEHADHEGSAPGSHIQLASYHGSAADSPAAFEGVQPASFSPSEFAVGNSLLHSASFTGSSLRSFNDGVNTLSTLPPSVLRDAGPSTGKADPDAPGRVVAEHTPPPTEDGVDVIPPADTINFNPLESAGRLTENSLTALAGFTTANAAGMHSTHIDGQAAVALMAQHGLSVSGDGSRFYAQNAAGENVQLQFDSNGRATLPDGTVVQASQTDAGTELSVFNNGTDNPATDNFLVQSLCEGELNVSHSDSSHTALDSITMSANAAGDIHAQAYDAAGRKTYGEDWNGNLLKTTNYDAHTQDVSGFSVVQPTANNGSLTNYYDRDSNALGATYSQFTDNGFVSAVYNADGQAVSYERDAFNADGTYSATSINFNDDGSVYNAQTNNFDSSGSLLSTTPLDARYAAAFDGDITNIGQISSMPQFNEVTSNMACPAGSTYAAQPGAEVITLGAARAADLAVDESNRRAEMAAAAARSDDFRRSALESSSTVWTNNGAVVPDGNVFGHSAASGGQEVSVPPAGTRYEVSSESSNSWAPTSSVAYSQNNEIGNSYATPVTTSSVEVVPPISFGSADNTSVSNYSRDQVDANSYSSSASNLSASTFSAGGSSSIVDASYAAGGPSYSTVQVDQDVNNVKASDAAHRIAFDASPTSYQAVDQSVDHSVSYNSNAAASFETTQPLHTQQVYCAQSSSSLMDQVSQARSENAFRAVEAHNMASEVRSQIVPDSQQSVISNAGLAQHVQSAQAHNQSEYYSAPAASSFAEPSRSIPVVNTSSCTAPESSVPVVNTSSVAERIAFDAAPNSYHPVDQSVEYNSSAVTHQHESASLMDQVVAARKESALQTNDAYKSELRKELIPGSTAREAPVQIWAAARTRQTSQPAQPPARKVENRSLNSLLDSKNSKRQMPPMEASTESVSHQAELVPPMQSTHAAEVPSFLGRLRDAVEPESVQSTNQSLEQQVINSSNRNLGGSAFSSALGRANAARISSGSSSSEHLNNALVGYHTINSLIQAGKVQEAQNVANCALDSLSQCNGADPQVVPLIQAFVQLFEQKNMPTHAAAFRAREQSVSNQLATVGSDFARNVWGS